MERKITVIRFEVFPNVSEPESVAIRLLLEANGRIDKIETAVPIMECVDPETGETYPAEQVVALSLDRVTSPEHTETTEVEPERIDEETGETIPAVTTSETFPAKTFRKEIIERFEAMEAKPAIVGMEIVLEDTSIDVEDMTEPIETEL